MAELSKSTELLLKRGADLTPNMVKVSKSVCTAVNFSVSNVSMIEGENGLILIDAGQDVEDSEIIFKEFRKISQKPIIAIIYTHGHPDHTMGTPAFLEQRNNDSRKVEIWARDNFNAENKQFAHLAPIFGQRGARQAGLKLPPEKRFNNGLAPMKYTASGGFNAKAVAVPPTHTFSGDKISIKIDNIDLELYAAPGETADQLYVWFKAEKVLFSGDNVYRSFPNLYAVRGSGYRDVSSWIKAVDDMLYFKPHAVVLGHTMPTLTSAESLELLTNYRDAIKYIFDKSVEGMNLGLTEDELAEYVKLPPELADKDYLLEFYGNVEWSVRSIFTGHLGWFDGNARKLMPFTLKEEAEHYAKLVGGKEKLFELAKVALKENDPKWAALLADHCLNLGMPAEEIKADAIDAMAMTLLTATGRNYMLTYADELREKAKAKK